jgi:hypothetical protein
MLTVLVVSASVCVASLMFWSALGGVWQRQRQRQRDIIIATCHQPLLCLEATGDLRTSVDLEPGVPGAGASVFCIELLSFLAPRNSIGVPSESARFDREPWTPDSLLRGSFNGSCRIQIDPPH